MSLVEEIVMVCVMLIKSFMSAGDDKLKQEAALMEAEEKLATARAKAKFG